jgi:hypothetical protein
MLASKTVIGGLSITSVLADQPSATIYQAKAVDTGEARVLKIPRHSCRQVSDECSLLCSVSHPSIIQASEVATANGPALSMPFAFGGDLLTWIQPARSTRTL